MGHRKPELPTSSRSHTCGFHKADALPLKEKELVSELRPTLDSPVTSVLRIVKISNDDSVMRINSKRMMINFELGPQLRSISFVGALSCMILFVNSTNSPTNFMPII